MKNKASLMNPFPGLRSFRSDEDYLFFGREEQTLELMGRLQRNRFIAVVGTSGRGKSSLVRCGLLSRLQGGGMVDAGAHWEIAVMHPGGDPLRHLAEALLDAGLHERAEENALPQLLATLGRSQFGLIQAVRQAGLPAGTNFLLVVDQFEEIFRYDEAGQAESEVANDFIAMLREASAQTGVPIYIVATMRSDFIGDCSRFEGLAETVNRGEYLIPGLSREQFKSAIEGPIRVAGGQITPRLLQRLLNDLGEEEDQLPCLQHALMRTWRVWQGRADAEALDLEDYAQVGKMSQALSVHADEVYQGLAGGRQRELCAAMFKALTVEGSEKRGIRRPRRLQALGRILGVEKAELLPVIDAFRQPEVSFLVPPADVELRDATVIDLSHESLMRVWTRLREWVNEEAQSVGIFRRLSESAALWRQGRTELCRDPELSIARGWLQSNRPNAAWAEQYEGSFDEAMGYLKSSNDAAEAEIRERELRARAEAARKTRRLRWLVGGLTTAVAALLVGAFFGIRAQRRAAEQAARVDLATGSRLLDEGKIGDGLAHLVSAAGRVSASGVAATRILTTLASHTFALPAGAALDLKTRIDTVRILAGEKSALVQGEDGRVRLIDLAEWKVAREYQFEHKVHPTGLRTAAKNPDVFAVALDNGTIVVCDVATGRPRFAPITPPNHIVELNRIWQEQKRAWTPLFALSPDGRWLQTINGSWTIFDATTGEERSSDELYHGVQDNDSTLTPFSPDGRTIVTSSSRLSSVTPSGGYTLASYLLELRSVPDGKVLAVFSAAISSGPRQGTIFSADGKRLLVLSYLPGSTAGASRAAAFVHDTETLALVGPPIPYAGTRTNEIWLTPDGARVLIASNDRTVTVYEVATGKLAYSPLLHGGPVALAGLSDDGTMLATFCVDGQCRLWNLTSGKLAAESTYRMDRPSPAVLGPGGRTLLVTSQSGLVRRLQSTRAPAAPLVLPRNAGSPVLATFAAQPPARVLWFETRAGRVVDVASGNPGAAHFRLPFTITNSLSATTPGLLRGLYGDTLNSGDRLIARPSSGERRLWLMRENGVVADPAVPDPVGTVTSIFLMSPSGNFALAPFAPTGETRAWGIWDLRTGKQVGKLGGFPFFSGSQAAYLNCFSPDDRRVAVYEEKTDTSPEGIRVYDVAEAKLRFRIPADEKATFRTVRFNPAGTRLLTGNTWGSVQVWDAATGKLLQSTQAHSFVVGRFDFSQDGRFYASLSQDGTVQVWDAATDEPVGGPLVHAGAIERASFSTDDKRISVAAADGSGRVWDIASGLPLNEPTGTQGENVVEAGFSPDNRFIMTGSGEIAGAQRLWAAPPKGGMGRAPKWLLQLATICAGRRLNDVGKIVNAVDEYDRLDEVRREIAALPADDVYAEWARWFLSDNSQRPIAPGFTITPAQASKLAEDLNAPDPLFDMTARDNALLVQRKFAESEPLEREMLAWVIKRDGADSTDSVMGDHLVKIAQTLIMVGKFEEAEKMARACLALREKSNAENTYQIQSARATLASALVGQKRYAEAEKPLAKACEFFKTIGAQPDLGVVQITNRVSALAQLYEATGRPEKAAEWKQWNPSSGVPVAPAPGRGRQGSAAAPRGPAPSTKP